MLFPIKISKFSPELKEQTISLISDIQKNEFSVDINPDDQPDLQNIPQFYQVGKGNFWVATDQENVVGTIALLDIGGNKAALRKMFVHKNYRGKKYSIALQLLKTLLEWARAHNLETIYLGTTPVFFAAHRFYEKNGFKEISPNDLPSSFPIMKVDKKFYKYSIPENQSS